ncbi:MAG: ATP-dependent zinc metalloprotease FtsH, partial [Chloroflexota bacterium]
MKQMQSSGEATSEIGFSQVAAYAKAGQISRIVEDGGNLEVTLTNGTTVKSRREPDLGLTQSLRNYGVSDEQLSRIDFHVRGQSDWGWLGSTFWLLPLLFIFLMMALFMRQGNSQPGGGNVFSFSKSRARRITADQPSIHFSDVAGVDEAKEELAEVVEFLRSPQKFIAVGARIPKGVLLVGPPGTGKTLMARAVAGEASVPFFHISGSEFVELFVGVGASRVRDLFEEAKKNAPCIVFIDEIDAVGRQRGRGLGGGNDEREQTLNQILVEMDGFDKNTGIVVIAATNRPDILDTALLRPGRFDRRVVLDSPDLAGRLDILKVHARGKPLAPDVELDKTARQTPGFSGADLENLLNEAAILAARRNETVVTGVDLEEAIDRVIAGPERKGRLISDQEKSITAYHEVGHTLVAYYMPHLDPIHKVTVIARGHSGGHTRLLPTEDRHLWTRSQMSEMLAFAMGGLAAEELIFGETTTGPSNDLQQATDIARKMATMYGMSEKLGTVSLGSSGIVDYMGTDLMEP